MPIDQISPRQANPEVTVNDGFDTLGASSIFGKRPSTCNGLTWGYYGGRWGGTAVADGTLALDDAATNYVVVELSTGIVSASTGTTRWNDPLYARLYKLTTNTFSVTAEEDHRAGTRGLFPSPGDALPASADTDDVPEGATNRYFTEARVRATPLTGLSTASSAAVTATDTVLQGMGKAQAQIDLKAPLASPAFSGSVVIDEASTSINALHVTNSGSAASDPQGTLGGALPPMIGMWSNGVNRTLDLYTAINAAATGNIRQFKSRGTFSSPLAINSGDIIGANVFFAHTGNGAVPWTQAGRLAAVSLGSPVNTSGSNWIMPTKLAMQLSRPSAVAGGPTDVVFCESVAADNEFYFVPGATLPVHSGKSTARWASGWFSTIDSSGPVKIGQYTLSTLPSASVYSGYLIDVTDATGGPKTCRSDGTNWKILNTTTTVS